MYSTPTGSDASELHAETFGTGIRVWVLTVIKKRVGLSAEWILHECYYLTKFEDGNFRSGGISGGPAMGNGILATTSLLSSFSVMRALPKAPSILSIVLIGEELPPAATATAHNWSTLKCTYLRSRACVSLARKRPLVYVNSSSRLIRLPWLVMERGHEDYTKEEGLKHSSSFLKIGPMERLGRITVRFQFRVQCGPQRAILEQVTSKKHRCGHVICPWD